MENTKMGRILFVLGWIIIIAAFFIGTAVSQTTNQFGVPSHENWAMVTAWTFAGLVAGVFFMGLSEIIKLLNNISEEL